MRRRPRGVRTRQHLACMFNIFTSLDLQLCVQYFDLGPLRRRLLSVRSRQLSAFGHWFCAEVMQSWPICSGGPEASDHVNILSNHGVLRDVLRIAAGHGDEVGRPSGRLSVMSEADAIHSASTSLFSRGRAHCGFELCAAELIAVRLIPGHRSQRNPFRHRRHPLRPQSFPCTAELIAVCLI